LGVPAVGAQRTVDEADPVPDHDPQPQIEVDDLANVDVEGAGRWSARRATSTALGSPIQFSSRPASISCSKGA
jgi:hypothetical protein